MKMINDKMKGFFNKKYGTTDTTFGTLNPLTSHLYYKISYKYLRMFISKDFYINISSI